MEKNNKLPLVGNSPHLISPVDTRKIMLDVLIALMPALIFSFWNFGWRCLILSVVSCGVCVALEQVYEILTKRPSTVGDLSAVVTGLLLVFVLPASVPFWMVIVGDFFAIVVVKQLFGGLGKNFMNPALAARIFLSGWADWLNTYPASRKSEGFLSLPLFRNLGLVDGTPDVVSSATPLAAMKSGSLPEGGILRLLLGTHSGTVGEVSAILLLAGGAYLLFRKVIGYRIPVGYLGTVALLSLLFPQGNTSGIVWMFYSLFTGGLLLGAIFMATDYSTSPVTPGAQWVYAVGCGLLTFVIRRFGAYNEGVAYSILIMNSTVWLLDKYIRPVTFGHGKHTKENAEAIMTAIKTQNDLHQRTEKEEGGSIHV